MSADPTSTTPIAEPPSGNPPAPPPRLVVEHLLGVSVVGWAHDPAAPGQERLVLVCGRQTFEPVLRRVPRADVSRALGLAPELMPGFEFDLPLEAWAALGEPDAAFGLRLGPSGPLVQPSERLDEAFHGASPAPDGRSADLRSVGRAGQWTWTTSSSSKT